MLQFIQSVEQLTLLDAADEASALVRAPSFTEHLPKFSLVRFDALAWAHELRAVTREARITYTERDVGNDEYEDEARQVREISEAFAKWVSVLHSAARAIESTDHPIAGSVAKIFKLHDFDSSSTKAIFGEGPSLMMHARKLGDLTALGLPPSFFDEGQALLDRVLPELDETVNAKGMRMSRTDRLHALLDQAVQLMERFARYREFAMAMSRSEIPELGLAQVRAALAPRPNAAAPVVPTTPSLT